MAARSSAQAGRSWSVHCDGRDLPQGPPFQEAALAGFPSDHVVFGGTAVGLAVAGLGSVQQPLAFRSSITGGRRNLEGSTQASSFPHCQRSKPSERAQQPAGLASVLGYHLTYQRSYYARLNYVHENPCRHGLVPVASSYPWCSAAWFERTATPAFFKTVSGFKTDQISIQDDFEVIWERE